MGFNRLGKCGSAGIVEGMKDWYEWLKAMSVDVVDVCLDEGAGTGLAVGGG